MLGRPPQVVLPATASGLPPLTAGGATVTLGGGPARQAVAPPLLGIPVPEGVAEAMWLVAVRGGVPPDVVFELGVRARAAAVAAAMATSGTPGAVAVPGPVGAVEVCPRAVVQLPRVLLRPKAVGVPTETKRTAAKGVPAGTVAATPVGAAAQLVRQPRRALRDEGAAPTPPFRGAAASAPIVATGPSRPLARPRATAPGATPPVSRASGPLA